MSTKDIRTTGADLHVSCDVCGRTLLRGERAHPYLEGGDRRTVCELCVARAQQEGWLREGTVPAYDGRDSSSHRRRPLLRRLRRRASPAETAAPEPGPEEPEPVPHPAPPERVRPPVPEPRPEPRQEPRHVRAIPASPEQRMAAAVDAFNSSEHPRTIAGIARSLGLPSVSIDVAANSASSVRLLAAWELCWYRYEADLRDDPGTVRLVAQGNELDELEPGELDPNAAADENGQLILDA